MRLKLGRPRAALIVAPHPDDETIGAFGLIRRLRAMGTAVRVIVVTDGAASHRASPRWPRDRLIRARRQETVRAMRAQGVTRGAVRFLGLPDGKLGDEAHAHRIARAVRSTPWVGLVVGPTPDDDHADHRFVARTLAAVRMPGARRLGFKVWPIGRPPRRAASLRVDPHAKRRAVLAYRTQTGLIADDPNGFALTARQIAAFSRPYELFTERRR